MSKKYISEKDKSKSVPVDLTQFNPEQQYLCEDCGVILAVYPAHLATQQFPFERGPHYICPKCHILTDFSAEKPPVFEDIKPLDVSAPTFVIVPEDKGDNMIQPKEYDPEPQEDQWLKNIGATLISKKIQV